MPCYADSLMHMQVSELARDVGGVAAALVQLRRIFPRADLAVLVVADPGLLLEALRESGAMERLEEEAEVLRALLPGVDIDR